MITHRPAWAEIDLHALRHNLITIKKRVGPHVNIMGIVKADAYGHGVYEVSKFLSDHEVDVFGVALMEEGIELRKKGIHSQLLLLGGIFEWEIERVIQYDLTVTLYGEKIAKLISEKAQHFGKIVKAHVYIDTGMGSIGVPYDRATEFIKYVKGLENLFLEGIYTHCSSSDEKEPSYTNLQIDRFKKVLAELKRNNLDIPLRHMANSGIIMRYPNAYFNVIRPGISLYGLYPSEEVSRSIILKPVLSLKTLVVHIKDAKAGDFIGYDRSYAINKPTRIAILPIGYEDGYNRLLSNHGYVLIHGEKAPVIGNICMDQCFVDVTHIKKASVGDEAVLYGKQGEQKISVEDVAKQVKTIPYEITCSISKRVPRIYLNKTPGGE